MNAAKTRFKTTTTSNSLSWPRIPPLAEPPVLPWITATSRYSAFPHGGCFPNEDC